MVRAPRGNGREPVAAVECHTATTMPNLRRQMLRLVSLALCSMAAACEVPADAPPSPPATSSAPVGASAPSASSSAAPLATALPPHVERAKADTLQRLPQLQRHPLVRAAYPETVKQIVESPDEVILYSMNTVT